MKGYWLKKFKGNVLPLLLESFLKTNQNIVRFCSFCDILTKTNQKRMHLFQFSKRTELNECIRSNFQNEQTKTNALVRNFKTN